LHFSDWLSIVLIYSRIDLSMWEIRHSLALVSYACSCLPAGIRRVEVPGEVPELSYPRDRSARFTDELISSDLKIFRYRYDSAVKL
jgi:hypothetical protein